MFHTDQKHGASLWINKPALLEQSNLTSWDIPCEATEAKEADIYQASHLDFTEVNFTKGYQETHNFKALLFPLRSNDLLKTSLWKGPHTHFKCQNN